ncbi:MAG: hypothetical protein A3E01_06385 [Gammaproteobacteria bacterium RIFCSPHIGHO2_12_FULL_63_22]|nr:MAG: hypothetical protein A3E01_06385 [Gammaproteobacteria bacterium RIFCSPHIGHO2_12_FULL_63_22]
MVAEPYWINEVLSFWFDELDEADWFSGGPHVDAEIRVRFLALHLQLVATDAAGIQEPRALLAAVIVLDQFSRNLFRGDPRAYASDPIARRLASQAIDAGYDQALPPRQRLFLYLPFEHSEHAGHQAMAVQLIGSLGNAGWTRYAQLHKDLIDKFGRFPGRNVALGRQSTPAELEALQGPNASF